MRVRMRQAPQRQLEGRGERGFILIKGELHFPSILSFPVYFFLSFNATILGLLASAILLYAVMDIHYDERVLFIKGEGENHSRLIIFMQVNKTMEKMRQWKVGFLDFRTSEVMEKDFVNAIRGQYHFFFRAKNLTAIYEASVLSPPLAVGSS